MGGWLAHLEELHADNAEDEEDEAEEHEHAATEEQVAEEQVAGGVGKASARAGDEVPKWNCVARLKSVLQPAGCRHLCTWPSLASRPVSTAPAPACPAFAAARAAGAARGRRGGRSSGRMPG